MTAALLASPPSWHEVMDCVLSLAVGAALADSIDPERRNLMKPVRGEALIEGQLAHGEVVAIREFFGVLCADPTYIATVDEGMAAYTKKNRHPTNVCKYLALACTEQQKLALITLLIRLAQADGEIGPREAWYIERAGFVMEVPDDVMPDIAGAGGPVPSTAHLGANLAGHCGVLGVKPPVSIADLKAAYRAAAMRNHPDTLAASGGVSWEDANRRFREVRRSYEALLRAAEAGLLGGPVLKKTKKDLASLQEAARAFWSAFPASTWSAPAKTIEELRDGTESCATSQRASATTGAPGKTVKSARNRTADGSSPCPRCGDLTTSGSIWETAWAVLYCVAGFAWGCRRLVNSGFDGWAIAAMAVCTLVLPAVLNRPGRRCKNCDFSWDTAQPIDRQSVPPHPVGCPACGEQGQQIQPVFGGLIMKVLAVILAMCGGCTAVGGGAVVVVGPERAGAAGVCLVGLLMVVGAILAFTRSDGRYRCRRCGHRFVFDRRSTLEPDAWYGERVATFLDPSGTAAPPPCDREEQPASDPVGATMMWIAAMVAGAWALFGSRRHVDVAAPICIGGLFALYVGLFMLRKAIRGDRCPLCDGPLHRVGPDRWQCPGCGFSREADLWSDTWPMHQIPGIVFGAAIALGGLAAVAFSIFGLFFD